MRQDRFEEARTLAQALQEGLREVREDVTALVSAEVRRAGLTDAEARRLIRSVVEEQLTLREQERRGLPGWLWGAVVAAVAGAGAALATLALTGALPI